LYNMTVKLENKNLDTLIRLGTRGSPLALVQANMVRDAILKVKPGIEVRIIKITTSGDWKPEHGETRLKEEEGGKGQFAKEIEQALLEGTIDIAVHSMKDMETRQPYGLEIPFMLPREDVRDAFLSFKANSISDLPQGAVVGTSSVRRSAFLRSIRPDLEIVPFRGNVQTRIDKMKAGQVDATFLACAGLNRLGLANQITSIIPVKEFFPAVGQGAVGIEIRSSDKNNLSFFSQFLCAETYLCVAAERAVLRELDGSCHTPIGVYACKEGNKLFLRVSVVSEDGKFRLDEEDRDEFLNIDSAEKLGKAVAKRVRHKIPDGIL